MSIQYDDYLSQHVSNVKRGYNWLRSNIPEIFEDVSAVLDLDQLLRDHDRSKYMSDEYLAYDDYFYGGSKSYDVVQKFRKAWLTHIHRNPHHWQHWVLINDDPSEGEIIMEMPYEYIVEMICDWWAFSWAQCDLNEIFTWYAEHEKYMKLHDNTRKTVETILKKIKEKIEEMEFDS